MIRARRLGLVLSSLLFAAIACGPGPASPSGEGPSGTLVVVVRQGPERVPFHPKVARIRQANDQLAAILGRSIRIELDGALLPQTREDAEDVIARVVETVAQDAAALARGGEEPIAFARARFERLVVRYAPVEAAEREGRGGGRYALARLDEGTKTIDVVRGSARGGVLERGEVAAVVRAAFEGGADDRYARVLPDALPSAEHRGWFDFHVRVGRRAAKAAAEPFAVVGSVDGHRVRGMVMLHGLARSDAALARDVRAWLVRAAGDFASTYHHHAGEVERAPAASPYRRAESAYMGWLRAELPRMTLDERGAIAVHLWVIDFRKPHGERDRYATYAFPGVDRMALAFTTVDAWIAAGHPPLGRAKGGAAHPLFDTIVAPATLDARTDRVRIQRTGRGDGVFYAWALVDRSREDTFVKGVLARNDPQFAASAFVHARRVLRDEPDYLRFLRRFERAPVLWSIGADVLRESGYRPSETLLEECRRLWREVPAARGHALFWFARHADGSYHPDADWPDLLQGAPADDATLDAFLALGGEAFENLPAAWPGVAKSPRRIARVTSRAKERFGVPGDRGTVRALVDLARAICKEGSMDELRALRAFAIAELAARPGEGLSDVVEAADPAACKPELATTPSPRAPSPRATKGAPVAPDGRSPRRP